MSTDNKSTEDQIRAMARHPDAYDNDDRWNDALDRAADIAAQGEAALRAEIEATKATQARHSAERLEALNKNSWQAQRIAVLEGENGRLRADRDRLAADLAVAREALVAIDAIDPEAMIGACSDAAVRGLVLRMGNAARAALARITGGDNG